MAPRAALHGSCRLAALTADVTNRRLGADLATTKPSPGRWSSARGGAGMTVNSRELIERAYARLQHNHEVIEGAWDESAWVDLDASAPGRARVRGAPVLDGLLRTIRLADAAGCGSTQLFAGFAGSGKTSLLLQLGGRLRELGLPVIGVDVIGPNTAPLHRSVEALLLAMAVAIGEAVAPHQPPGHGTLRAWSSLLARLRAALAGVDPEIAGQLDLGWLKVHLRPDAGFHQQLVQALARRQGPVLEGFRQFLADVVASFPGARPVFLLDGLEKVHVMGPSQLEGYRTYAEIFLFHREVLALDDAHAVYVVPPQLFVAAPQLQNEYDFAQLNCVRVSPPPPHRRDERDQQGCAALVEVLRARVEGLDALLEAPAAEAMAFASGGHLRTLLRLAAAVLTRYFDEADVFPLSQARVEEAIAEHGLYMRSAARMHAAALRPILSEGRVDALDETQRSGLLDALRLQLALSYRNGDVWYDVHPLARPALEE